MMRSIDWIKIKDLGKCGEQGSDQARLALKKLNTELNEKAQKTGEKWELAWRLVEICLETEFCKKMELLGEQGSEEMKSGINSLSMHVLSEVLSGRGKSFYEIELVTTYEATGGLISNGERCC